MMVEMRDPQEGSSARTTLEEHLLDHTLTVNELYFAISESHLRMHVVLLDLMVTVPLIKV